MRTEEEIRKHLEEIEESNIKLDAYMIAVRNTLRWVLNA